MPRYNESSIIDDEGRGFIYAPYIPRIGGPRGPPFTCDCSDCSDCSDCRRQLGEGANTTLEEEFFDRQKEK